jgi:hypothetical protein
VRFYLGTHKPGWLATAGVPLMVSHRRLRERTTLPRAAAPWILDSGGFTELSRFGCWTISVDEYVAATRRYADEIGELEWCAPQDWMTEPFILAKTGLDVAEHQRRTVVSYLELAEHGLPVIPVLQGQTLDDYRRHVDSYGRAGVDLTGEGVVGVGSVCRRQATSSVGTILEGLAPLRLHGFGVKTLGLERWAPLLVSSDSAAWSYNARRRSGPCPQGDAMNCANCLHRALDWRDRVVAGCAG